MMSNPIWQPVEDEQDVQDAQKVPHYKTANSQRTQLRLKYFMVVETLSDVTIKICDNMTIAKEMLNALECLTLEALTETQLEELIQLQGKNGLCLEGYKSEDITLLYVSRKELSSFVTSKLTRL